MPKHQGREEEVTESKRKLCVKLERLDQRERMTGKGQELTCSELLFPFLALRS